VGIENEQARIEKILSFLIEQDDFHSDLFVRRLVSLGVDFVEIVSLLLQSDSEYLESIKAILHVVSDYYFKFKSAPSKQVIVNETRWKGIEANSSSPTSIYWLLT
jgi:sulfur relay (sulfurtransferase) DsrC/TusE family protein